MPPTPSPTVERLRHYIAKRMRMSHIYQPLMLMELLGHGFARQQPAQPPCQPTSKTGPAPTPKVSHPEAIGEPLPAALAASHGSPLQGSSAVEKRSTAGVGFGLAKTANAHTAGGMVALEGVMETPEEVAVMRQLLERGWSRRRIAAELGISRNTLNRYLAIGDWQPYSSGNRSSQLDGHQEWLQQQF